MNIATELKTEILRELYKYDVDGQGSSYNKKLRLAVFDGITSLGNKYVSFNGPSSGNIILQQIEYDMPSGSGVSTTVNKLILYEEPNTGPTVTLFTVNLDVSEQAEYGEEGGIFRIGELKLTI